MKRSLLLSLTFLLTLSLQAQCGAKGLKAIDEKDYKTAWASLEECLQADADDISANFGMSRLYGADAAKKDRVKALEHLQKAEAGWAKLDEKGKGKFEKVGLTNATLEERRDRIEASYLEAAKATNTVAGYEEFLIAFPTSKSSTACRNYRNDLAFRLATQAGTVGALDDYLTTYPDAENVPVVTKARDQRATTEALQTNTEEALTNFLKRYPQAQQAPQIQQRLNALAFENAKAANTVEAFQSYIARFPESVFIMQAREKLEWLQAQEQK